MLIPSELSGARQAQEKLLKHVAQHGYSEASRFAIKLAVEEAVNNAIRHGNQFRADKSVELRFEVGPEQTVITISDEGEGFDPDSLPDPTIDENLEKPTGRGVMLMRAYMDEVQFSKKGNQVRMVKHNT